jgi:hypothetical protein
MKAVFTDEGDARNPRNGKAITAAGLSAVFAAAQTRPPFIVLLEGEDGCDMTVGVGPTFGFVQWADRDALAQVAVSPRVVAEADIEFVAGGTSTPVPRRYLMPISSVESIAAHFLATGRPDHAVAWESI